MPKARVLVQLSKQTGLGPGSPILDLMKIESSEEFGCDIMSSSRSSLNHYNYSETSCASLCA